MRAFFNYYGTKMRIAKHYGPPRDNIVIEPFAGSAGYSVYWGVRTAYLYDVDETICDLWDWLINCEEQDVLDLPDVIRDQDHLDSLPYYGQLLIKRWFVSTARINRKMPIAYYHRRISGEERGTRNYRPNPNVWSRRTKYRIVEQKPFIANWTIDQLSYERIPDLHGHWHVDPPYSSKSGSAYVHNNSNIDFAHLAEWCKARSGEIDVCEMDDADWLPFRLLRQATNSGGKQYREVLWSNQPEKQMDLLANV